MIVTRQGLEATDATRLVIVVAPDSVMRRSLEFALTAEGFLTVSLPTIGSALNSQHAGTAVCTIIDDNAVEDWSSADEMLGRFLVPIVLLLGERERPVTTPSVIAVSKPFLGEPLIAAVNAIVGRQSTGAT